MLYMGLRVITLGILYAQRYPCTRQKTRCRLSILVCLHFELCFFFDGSSLACCYLFISYNPQNQYKMDIHLVLKQDPSLGNSPNFVRSSENKIGFSKFQTQFEFKTVSLPNENVFDKVANPLIQDKFLKGEDVLLLTLGPTNSGKSHLLFQNNDSIVKQSLQAVFNDSESYSGDIDSIRKYYPEVIDSRTPSEIDSSSSSNYFSISMFELYNDSVIDLLNRDNKTQKGCYDIITDSIDYKLTPKNISKVLVNSYESAHDLIYDGYSRRKTYPTFANNLSSRSHCFIFLNTHKLYSNVLKTTRCTIVDLAGLERSKSSRTSGQALREGSHTNGSLTELGRCLELISMNQFHRTCLRTNKLTRLVLTDFVKNHNSLSILITLDPFGEAGLILQTLRYIDPIKHQVLQRRSLLASKNRYTISPTTTDSALTSEIDRLRKSQKVLKERINILENSIVETESRVRRDMYNENENNLASVVIKHREEIDKLNETHLAQTDQKLQDQADLFKQNLADLKNELKLKSNALECSEAKLCQVEAELQRMTKCYDSLNITMNEKLDLKESNYKKLEQRFEEINVQNEALHVEINTLQLTVKDIENTYEQTIRLLKEEHQKNLESLQIQLDQSISNFKNSETTIMSLSEKIEQKDYELNEVHQLFEKTKASLKELEESSKHESLANQTELLLKQEKLEGELRNYSQKLADAAKEYDINIATVNANLDMLKKQLQDKETDFNKNNERLTIQIESLKQELQDTQNAKLQLQNEINALHIKMETATNELNGIIVLKDSEISLLRDTTQQSVVEKEKLVILLKAENQKLLEQYENKTKEVEKLQQDLLLKQDELSLMQIKLKDYNAIQNDYKFNEKKLSQLEESLRSEMATSKLLQEKIKSLEQSTDVEMKKHNENADCMGDRVRELENSLVEKDKAIQNLLNTKNETNQKLLETERLNATLNEEVLKIQKMTAKYTSLKAKSGEITQKIVSVEKENNHLKTVLDIKEKKLLEAEDKINKFAQRLQALENRSHEPDSKSDPLSVNLEKSITTSPQLQQRSLSVLDTDPLDDVGLPLMLSSPLKPPSFHIHSDSIEKDNTITLPVTERKKKSNSKKLSKKDKLDKQIELHEKKMMESMATPKVERKKFKVLTNSKLSDLNKQNLQPGSPTMDKQLKRKKSSSPLKPGKKKLRKSLGPSDSMELLN